MPDYTITTARPEHLEWLSEIELAAADLFKAVDPELILTETTNSDVLARAQRERRLWVALAGEKTTVGFALVELIEVNVAHLEELDVHPDHGRRGLGTLLVRHVCRWAAASGYSAVTLTTFRDIPWNAPFYSRLGFEVVPREHLSPQLAAVVDAEARRGLEPARRVVMRRVAASDHADAALLV